MGEVTLTTLPDKAQRLTEPYSAALSNHPQQFRDWIDGTNVSVRKDLPYTWTKDSEYKLV